MKKILLLALGLLWMSANEIVNHQIYERTDRFDLMLNFSGQFNQKITQENLIGMTKITIFDTVISEKIDKTFNNAIIKKFSITPLENKVEIVIENIDNLDVSASKTIDGFGLRIRIKQETASARDGAIVEAPIVDASPSDNTTSVAPLKPVASTPKPIKLQEEPDYTMYFVVMIVLVGIVVGLLYIKNVPNNKFAWIFGKKPNQQDIVVHYQKAIDAKNKAVLLEYDNTKYLVVLGTTNIMLDKFSANTPRTERKSEFNVLLREEENKLNKIVEAQRMMRNS